MQKILEQAIQITNEPALKSLLDEIKAKINAQTGLNTVNSSGTSNLNADNQNLQNANISDNKSKDEAIIFNDKNLEKRVREVIKKSNGDIYAADVKDVTKLDLTNSQISNIQPLKYFINLAYLNLTSNQISDISALKG